MTRSDSVADLWDNSDTPPRDAGIQDLILARLVKVLREMAKTDEKLANVLRSFSLL